MRNPYRLIGLAATTAVLLAAPVATAPSAGAAATVPTPVNVAASARTNGAAVSWALPFGAPSGTYTYTVTSTPGGFTCTTSSLGCTVQGLTNGTRYAFTVVAASGTDVSPTSTASNVVTPHVDTLPPTVGSPSVFPSSVPEAGGNVSIALTVNDDLAGVDPATVRVWFANASRATTPPVSLSPYLPGGSTYAASYPVPAGLAPGRWKLVVAPVGDLQGNRSAQIAYPDLLLVGAPAAPTGLIALPATGTGRPVQVTWSAPVDDGGNAITGYRIMEDNGTLLHVVDGPSTSATVDVGDYPSTWPLRLKIQSVNAAGASTDSELSPVITVPATVTSAPLRVRLTPASVGGLQVRWNAPAHTGGDTSRSWTVTLTGTKGDSFTKTVAAAHRSATFSGLRVGERFTARVVAHNVAGASATSHASNALTAPDVHKRPSRVATPKAKVLSATRIALTWQRPATRNATPVTSYRVLVRSGGTTVRTIAVASAKRSVTIPRLHRHTRYAFVVRAKNTGGLSVASKQAVVWTRW